MSSEHMDTWNEIRFDANSRLFQLRSSDGITSVDFGASFEINGELLTLVDATSVNGNFNISAGSASEIIAEFGAIDLKCVFTITQTANGETILIDTELVNIGNDTLTLRECSPVSVTPSRGAIQLRGDTGNAVYLASSGTTSPSKVYRCADQNSPHRAVTIMHVVSHEAKRALNISFITLDRMPTRHTFAYDNGFTEYNAICSLGGYKLAPGATIKLELLTVEARADLHESLHKWADRVSVCYQPDIWPKIPGSWLGWAWVDAFNVETYEDVVVRNVKAIRERLKGFDLEYVWVSIGNIGRGLPGNWLDWNYDSFPNGHEYLVNTLDEFGFRLGFWVGPFYIASWLENFVNEMHDALLKRDGKLAEGAAQWRYGEPATVPASERPCCYSLDPTHPKGAAFLEKVFSTYRDWGVRYYMIDFIHAAAYTPDYNPYGPDTAYNQHYNRTIVSGTPVMREGLQIIAEASGDDTYRLSSSGATFACVGTIAAARIGNDYGEGRAINPEAFFYPATFVINRAEAWTGHQCASDNMAGAYFTHKKLYLNDSGNVMTVDKPIPIGDAQITATIFGMSGGPIMLGDDIDRMAEERLALIKKVFPRTDTIATPVDLFDAPFPDYPKIFTIHVDAGWDEWDVVAVLNYDDDVRTETIPLTKLGLDSTEEYTIWEFWNEQYLGTITGELRPVIPPHSARLYRLRKRLNHPWVLATDMHVMQGQVDIADVAWNKETMTLSGKAMRPEGEIGNLFIYVPTGLYVVNPQGFWIAKDGNDNTLIIRAQFKFEDRPAEWSIQFAPIAE